MRQNSSASGLPSLNARIEQVGAYSLLIVAEWKEKARRAGKRLVDLSLGDPQEPTPEFIRRRLMDCVTPSSSYPPALGTAELRESASGWLQRRLGLSIASDQIVPTAGSKEAIFHFAQVLAPGTRVGYPIPGYPVYAGAIALAGLEAVPIMLTPENGFAFDPELNLGTSVEAVWICSPHNPTGTVLKPDSMKSILEWARQRGVLILSDECYLDSFDPGTPQPESFLALARDQGYRGVVSFFTLSKRSGMTGYRSGFVAGDPVYLDAFKKYRPHAGLASPTFVQQAAAAAWADDAHVASRGAIYAAKRSVVKDFLRDRGWQSVDSNSTFYVWARLPAGYPPARQYLEELALSLGIVATPGDCFGDSPLVTDWFRIALVPPIDELQGALALWKEFDDKGKR
jgi:aspartate/methionine/tyrosine aminotransferase